MPGWLPPEGRPRCAHGRPPGTTTFVRGHGLQRGDDVPDDGRRARIVSAVTGRSVVADVGELMLRLCRFAVDEMALSGCALVLMAGLDAASVLASAGPHARTVTTLQLELGEG